MTYPERLFYLTPSSQQWQNEDWEEIDLDTLLDHRTNMVFVRFHGDDEIWLLKPAGDLGPDLHSYYGFGLDRQNEPHLWADISERLIHIENTTTAAEILQALARDIAARS